MQKTIYKIKYIFLALLIFFAGITNDILSLHIVKKISPIELILIVMSIYYIFFKRKIKLTLLTKWLLLLNIIFFFSSFYTSNYLPSDTFVVSPGLFTSYETRSLMSSLQFLYLIILTIVFTTFLYSTKISKYNLEKMLVYAITAFSIIGLLFYILNIFGINISLIQSNELSYSVHRLYSFGLEPQYTALFIVPGVFISFFNRWHTLFFINVVAFILTLSTSALLGFIIAIVFYSLKNVKFISQLIVLPLVLLIGYLFYGFAEGKLLSFLSVFSGDDTGINSARALSIVTAIDLLKEYWIGGIGWGNFSFYFLWRDEERVFNLGNLLFRIITESGVPALFVFSAIMIYIYKYTKFLSDAYLLILIVFFVYFMANSTMFLMVFFWIYLIIFEYLSKKENYVKRS